MLIKKTAWDELLKGASIALVGGGGGGQSVEAASDEEESRDEGALTEPFMDCARPLCAVGAGKGVVERCWREGGEAEDVAALCAEHAAWNSGQRSMHTYCTLECGVKQESGGGSGSQN